ncbi:FHA domain-containing protein [Roseovarius sp. 2305UL8-3]|uniref:FHA domain-containing protein n=1 Tax=Roseovarius conchicola TaxID=3121636 RepID=UPI003527025D
MKFIREIIGEKRQMEENALRESEAAPTDGVPGHEQPAQDDMLQADKVEADLTSESNIYDEFAEIFGEDHEPVETAEQAAETPVQEEDVPAPRTRKLVPASPMAVDTEAPQDAPEETEVADESTLSPDSGSASSDEQDTEQSLQRVFQELNEPPANDLDEQPLASDDEADTGPDMQPSEMAYSEPAVEDVPAMEEPESPVAAQPQPAPAEPRKVEVPQPALGRGKSQHGRVKTRLLGFNTSMDTDIDPIKDSDQAKAAAYTSFPVGWLIVVEGEGRGSAFSLFNGVSNIGRGTDQTVCLDFGDNSISREAHASIAYDERQQSFYIGHTGKANIVRRNDRPVLSTEELVAGDHITIGETTLRFVPLCGPDFSWEKSQDAGRACAANG